jgi:hypothetical protein
MKATNSNIKICKRKITFIRTIYAQFFSSSASQQHGNQSKLICLLAFLQLLCQQNMGIFSQYS